MADRCLHGHRPAPPDARDRGAHRLRGLTLAAHLHRPARRRCMPILGRCSSTTPTSTSSATSRSSPSPKRCSFAERWSTASGSPSDLETSLEPRASRLPRGAAAAALSVQLARRRLRARVRRAGDGQSRAPPADRRSFAPRSHARATKSRSAKRSSASSRISTSSAFASPTG